MVLELHQNLQLEVGLLRQEVSNLRQENAELRYDNTELGRQNFELRQGPTGYWKSWRTCAVVRIEKFEAEVE